MNACRILLLCFAIAFSYSSSAQPTNYLHAKFHEYQTNAEAGNAWAQVTLGYCYAHGKGVETNYVEAFNWYRKAAAQTNASAQAEVGYFYANGLGVTTNYVEAVRWYRKAAENKDAWARVTLGICYESGLGVDRNLTEAVKQYRLAADQNDPWGQYEMGSYYTFQATNYFAAVSWYRKAAENNNTLAQYYLGEYYANGQGVKTNLVEAYAWLTLAADESAAKLLQTVEKQMSLQQISDAKKRAEELKAKIKTKRN